MPARLAPSAGRRPKPGIVHLGIGAFFRAFGIPWIAEAMEKSGGDWGVIGVSLKSARTRDALRDQGYCYTAVEMDNSGLTARPVEALVDIMVAPEDPDAVLTQMADPAIQIVSLTVTEKGYCHDPATGQLNLQHPDILHDLKSLQPVSAPGYIVRALDLRRRTGQAPFTVLSCDNLPSNGALVRGIVIDLATRTDPDLADWIKANVAFPSTMVDRIVPATTDADIAATAALTGKVDQAPVMHEPFRQWVIADCFNTDHPDFGAVGVQLVDDVEPFEDMKLRMLNGTHSAIAYVGYLAGHRTVADAIADPVIAGFVQTLWHNQIIPTLAAPEGVNLKEYASALLTRYRNPALQHSTWQIAMDGSQKLPQRILGALQDTLDAGRDPAPLLLVIAAWMRYVGGTDERGKDIDVRDPMADRLRTLTETTDPVGALLSVSDIFAPSLAKRVRAPLTSIYQDICKDGVRVVAQRMTI